MQQTLPPSPPRFRPKPLPWRSRLGASLRRFPHPREIWKMVVRVVSTADEHDVDIVAAGLAFYGLLGLFPSLLALVSLYGLIADPADVQRVLMPLAGSLPDQARQIVVAGLSEFVARSSSSLSLSLFVGLAALLFSASTAMSALVRAINLAYDIPERRSFFKRRRVAISFTVVGILGVAVIIPIIAALPKILGFFQIRVLGGVPFLVFTGLVFAVVLVLYRYAPDRKLPPSLRGTLPGAVVAWLLWLAAGALYSLYVKNFANYGSTYGALEGVIALQFWLFISALVLLYGAELNADLEKRARR